MVIWLIHIGFIFYREIAMNYSSVFLLTAITIPRDWPSPIAKGETTELVIYERPRKRYYGST